MLLRFCIRINYSEGSTTVYSTARTPSMAISKAMKGRSHLKITKLEIIGDALPAASVSVAQIVKQAKLKKAKKTKRWQAALKYQNKSGLSIFLKK